MFESPTYMQLYLQKLFFNHFGRVPFSNFFFFFILRENLNLKCLRYRLQFLNSTLLFILTQYLSSRQQFVLGLNRYGRGLISVFRLQKTAAGCGTCGKRKCQEKKDLQRPVRIENLGARMSNITDINVGVYLTIFLILSRILISEITNEIAKNGLPKKHNVKIPS